MNINKRDYKMIRFKTQDWKAYLNFEDRSDGKILSIYPPRVTYRSNKLYKFKLSSFFSPFPQPWGSVCEQRDGHPPSSKTDCQ